MQTEKYTFKEMQEISHCLGIDYFKAYMSHKLKDKFLPTFFYRNYWCGSNETMDALCIKGCAIKKDNYYHITEEGISFYKYQYCKYMNYEKVKERGVKYLRNRINFYCEFYNLNYCENNSDHIFYYYQEYYLKKFKVSHTTGLVINYFKPELKKLFVKKAIAI